MGGAAGAALAGALPIVGERQTSTHDCVPAATASALQWGGQSVSEPEIVQWLTSRGLDTTTGVLILSINEYLTEHGWLLDSDGGSVPISQYVPAAIDAGHPVIGFFQCHGDATPAPRGSTTTAHCVCFAGYDESSYYYMDPWPPGNVAVPRSVVDAADLNVHTTINTTSSTGGSPDMADANFNLAAAQVIANSVFGRPIGSDLLSQIANDVAGMGWKPAWDKWAQASGANGEVDLLTRVDNIGSNPQVGPGLALTIASFVFGRPIGSDLLQEIINDVVSLGWWSAWEKWSNTAVANGEVSLLQRADLLQQTGTDRPHHTH